MVDSRKYYQDAEAGEWRYCTIIKPVEYLRLSINENVGYSFCMVQYINFMLFCSPSFISKFTEGKASAVKNYIGEI